MINESHSMFRSRIALFQISAAKKCLKFLAFWCRKRVIWSFKFLFSRTAYFFLFLFNYRICPLKRNIRPWAKCREIRRNFHSFFDCPLTTLLFYRTPSQPAPFRPYRSKPLWASSSNKTSHSSSNPYHEEILISYALPYHLHIYIKIHSNKKSEKWGRNEDDEIYSILFPRTFN